MQAKITGYLVKKNGKLIFKETDKNRELDDCNITSNTNIYFVKNVYIEDRKLPYEMYFGFFKFIQKLKIEGLLERPRKGGKW